MKFSSMFSVACFVAASFGFVACSDDSSSSPSDDKIESSSSGSSNEKLDCTVKDGVKVFAPKAGDTFKMDDTITVVYGSDVAGSGYRFVFKTSEDDPGLDMLEESAGPKEPDGKTCYEQKVVLDIEYAQPSDEAIIRVIPYEKTAKGANSETFKVTR